MGKPTSVSLSVARSLSPSLEMCLSLSLCGFFSVSLKKTHTHADVRCHDAATYTHIQNDPQTQHTKLHRTKDIQHLSYTVETSPSLSPGTSVFPPHPRAPVLPGLCTVGIGHGPTSVAHISGQTHISVSLSPSLSLCLSLSVCGSVSLSLSLSRKHTRTHARTHARTHTHSHSCDIQRYRTTPRLMHTQSHRTEGIHCLSHTTDTWT